MKKTANKLIAFITALLVFMAASAAVHAAAEAADKTKVKSMIDKTAEFVTGNADVLEDSDFDLLTLGLLQSGANVPDEYMNTYLAYIKESLDDVLASDNNQGRLTYISLALTAAGLNPANFDGKNLLAPLGKLTDVIDDIYSAPYVLMLLDNGYSDFTGEGATTRASLISWLLDQINSDEGGYRPDFGYGPSLDVDTTALIICALWPHRAQAGIQSVINKSIAVLSDEAVQEANGGYLSWGTESPESAARVITAICTIGKNPADGAVGFVKADGNPFTALSIFYLEETGGFYSPYGATDEPNSFSTRDGFIGLAAYSRLLAGNTASVYNLDNAGLANEITAMINALPAAITAKDIASVNSAKAKYDALPGYLKIYIINSDKLSAAVSAANALQNSQTTSSNSTASDELNDPIPPTGNGQFPTMIFAVLALCGMTILITCKAGKRA